MLLMDRFGYVKSVDVPTYERNKEAADAEFRRIIPCMSDDKILYVYLFGQMHLVKMSDVPLENSGKKGSRWIISATIPAAARSWRQSFVCQI